MLVPVPALPPHPSGKLRNRSTQPDWISEGGCPSWGGAYHMDLAFLSYSVILSNLIIWVWEQVCHFFDMFGSFFAHPLLRLPFAAELPQTPHCWISQRMSALGVTSGHSLSSQIAVCKRWGGKMHIYVVVILPGNWFRQFWNNVLCNVFAEHDIWNLPQSRYNCMILLGFNHHHHHPLTASRWSV